MGSFSQSLAQAGRDALQVLVLLDACHVVAAVPCLCVAVYVAWQEQRRRRRQRATGPHQPEVRVVHGFVFTVPGATAAE